MENELLMKYMSSERWRSLVGSVGIKDMKRSMWRHAYSFNAHAMEHVEDILCWDIAGWTLSVWATSQASYCRIHHTDPHLEEHTTEAFNRGISTQVISKNRDPCSAGLFCPAVVMFHSCLVELMSWRWVGIDYPAVWLSHPLCQFKPLPPHNYSLVHMRGTL